MPSRALPFACVLALIGAMAGCTDAASWEHQLESRIHDEFPDYRFEVTGTDEICVHRPNRRDVRIDAREISIACQGGPQDCGEQIALMIESLR